MVEPTLVEMFDGGSLGRLATGQPARTFKAAMNLCLLMSVVLGVNQFSIARVLLHGRG